MANSSDDEPEELPPFRWNWQAMVMVALTLLGLAVPLAGVVWMIQQQHPPRPVVTAPPAAAPAVVAAENPALRASLEKAAASLDVPPLDDEKPIIAIAVTEEDRPQKVADLRKVVTSTGGTLVEMEPGHRFLVSAPPGSGEAVRLALGGKPATASSAEKTAAFFEVRFP